MIRGIIHQKDILNVFALNVTSDKVKIDRAKEIDNHNERFFIVVDKT